MLFCSSKHVVAPLLLLYNHKFGTEINVLDSTTKSYEKSIVIDLFIANLSILNILFKL